MVRWSGSRQPLQGSRKARLLHGGLHEARAQSADEYHVRLARSGRPREFQTQTRATVSSRFNIIRALLPENATGQPNAPNEGPVMEKANTAGSENAAR